MTGPRIGSLFSRYVGLTRNQQLRVLGNGVVPQQGAAALAHLDTVRRTR